MFREEAVWIKEALKQIKLLPHNNNSAANLGASTASFRQEIQPHIHRTLIQPLIDAGWQVLHVDIKKENGVDLVADVTEQDFGEHFKHRFGLTICTNMLEHVEDTRMVAGNLFDITVPGGYILITVPYRYRKHLDPIDNMFRPTPAEITALFGSDKVTVIDESIIVIYEKAYYTKKKSKYPIWGFREIIGYYFGLRHKVSGVLLQVNKKK